MSGSTFSPEDDSSTSGKDTPSLAARRARLRGTLIRRELQDPSTPAPPASLSSNETESSAPSHSPNPPSSPVVPEPVSSSHSTSTPKPIAVTPTPAPTSTSSSASSFRARPSFGISMSSELTRSAAAEMLKNIDQAMVVCATNLANLQKVAAEQADALKILTSTLKDKSLHDAGIDLNSLSQSFSAALEPMKEVTRLVPAIDQLKTTVTERIGHQEEKLSPDDLVANLAEQLVGGSIDQGTFKSAYKAIFPDKSSADLLRGLVELLGAQRLSGGLFRAAYDAVQTSEAAAETAAPETLPAFEQLTQANHELQEALRQQEQEMQKMLADKDLELQNTKIGAADDKEQEYETLLKNKDNAISEREAELVMLRRQMEELRTQTHELVTGLQKQVTEKSAVKVPPPKPVVSESEPTAAETIPEAKSEVKLEVKPKQSSGFFDVAAERPKSFYSDNSIAIPAAQGTRQVAGEPAAKPIPAVASNLQQKPAGLGATATPSTMTSTPATSPSRSVTGGAGRHGTGVRAQVFEVIVRQALAGAPWREMCAGPMQVNSITAEEVEEEVKRRKENLS